VPWNNLPKIRDFMRPLYDEHEAAVTTGYVRWLLNAWRHGPNRAFRYRDGRAYLAE
jgi:fatty acid desaturase